MRRYVSGAVIAIQTFGDVLGFNPHSHILVTDGCFYGKGMFRVAPPLKLKKLEAIFLSKGWWSCGFRRQAPQHFLYFFPLPQGQGSFLPTLGASLRTCFGFIILPSLKYQRFSIFSKTDRS
jgi:hypothetical protein